MKAYAVLPVYHNPLAFPVQVQSILPTTGVFIILLTYGDNIRETVRCVVLIDVES